MIEQESELSRLLPLMVAVTVAMVTAIMMSFFFIYAEQIREVPEQPTDNVSERLDTASRRLEALLGFADQIESLKQENLQLREQIEFLNEKSAFLRERLDHCGKSSPTPILPETKPAD